MWHGECLDGGNSALVRGVLVEAIFEGKKGIPKNLSSQVLGEVRVNFSVRIPTKTFRFVNRRSELFRKFLGRLRMILCY